MARPCYYNRPNSQPTTESLDSSIAFGTKLSYCSTVPKQGYPVALQWETKVFTGPSSPVTSKDLDELPARAVLHIVNRSLVFENHRSRHTRVSWKASIFTWVGLVGSNSIQKLDQTVYKSWIKQYTNVCPRGDDFAVSNQLNFLRRNYFP